MKSNPSSVSLPIHEYRTKDLHRSTILVQSGRRLLRTERNGREAVYVFEYSPEIDGILAAFISGGLRLEPRGLFETWKALRSLAYSTIGDIR